MEIERFTEGLESLLDESRGLLGTTYAELRARHRPIDSRAPAHRLLMLEDRVQSSLQAIREGQQAQPWDPLSEAELRHIVETLQEEASTNPKWGDLQNQCAKPDFFDHLVLTLSLRRTLRENWGLDAVVVPEETGTRMPDLYVVRGGKEILAIEMKRKDELVDPVPAAFPAERARELIQKAFDATGSSATGQLRRGLPGVLALGGFYIQEGEMRLLMAGAKDWFRRNKGRRRSVAGILFGSLFVHIENAGDDPDLLPRSAWPQAAFEVDMAPNPSYTGELKIGTVSTGRSMRYPAGFRRWQSVGEEFRVTPEGFRRVPRGVAK